MSTAPVSSSSIYQEIQTFYHTRQADLQQLGSALQSGDLSGAQQAYKSLAVLGEGGPFANSEPFAKSSRAEAFNTLGEALQAGDLARAQAAFATLPGAQSKSTTTSTPASVVNLASTQPSTATTGNTPSIYQQRKAYTQQRQADLTQLGKDLQAGDLTAAQKDFDTLTALGQTGPYRNGQDFQVASRNQDFQAIGQALQNGDLTGAQSAFATLESTFANPHSNSAITTTVSKAIATPPSGPSNEPTPVGQAPAVPPVIEQGPPAPPAAQSGPELVIKLESSPTNASRASASGPTTPELVINLPQGNSASSASPEEVTINFGNGSSGPTVSIGIQGPNGSSTEQVSINLNPQSNYELILNLPDSNTTNQTQSSSGSALSVSA